MTKKEVNLIPITLPDLGAGMESVRVSTWLVDVGETVDPGERLVDVLIPGVSFSVASPSAGRLIKIERTTDCRVQQGEVLAWLEPVSFADPMSM
jgi:pyruvate/2-oxoglutarate dehydrogenase complex dihydrolipoamide acyltransferase (E2) component